jgi:glucose-6-phosphate dehydrogenase assembly protein OpcA
MEAENGSPVVVAGQSRAVNLSTVERELMGLWKSVAQERADDEVQVPTRASILNLVVCSPTEDALRAAAETIPQLTIDHPCRAILIASELGSKASSLEAWASVHCRLLRPARKQVCCEEIHISAGGESVGRLPGAIPPLLIPDLPVFLWWLGEVPLEDVLFDRLSGLADRVILDSAQFEDQSKALSTLWALVDRGHGRAVVSDLNWARLDPWRELAAQLFDPPDYRPYLARINSVAVEGNTLQSFLLIGWLASRLGWKAIHNPTRLTIGMAGHDGEVVVEMEERGATDSTSEGLLSLRLMASQPPAVFSISRSDDFTCAVTVAQVSEASPLRRAVRMKPLSEMQLLSRELNSMGRDPVYEEALQAAVGLRV